MLHDIETSSRAHEQLLATTYHLVHSLQADVRQSVLRDSRSKTTHNKCKTASKNHQSPRARFRRTYDSVWSIVGETVLRSTPTSRATGAKTAALSRLQRRSAKPTENGLTAATRLCQYVYRNPELSLQINRDTTARLVGYVNSSHIDCEGSESTEGYIFYYAGCHIICRSKKQTIVSYPGHCPTHLIDASRQHVRQF